MSPHTDAGALLKLAECPFCKRAVMLRKALHVSDGNVDAIIHAAPTNCGMVEFADGTTDESIVAKWNHQAASQGSAGAAQAQTGCDKEATFGEDGYNPAYDDGITFAIVQLAELTGSKDWQMRDGSEDHDTDVRNTIMDVLKCAGLYDDETGNFARIGPSVPSAQSKSPCVHNVIIGLDGAWHCQTCGDGVDMAVAQTSTNAPGAA